MGITEKKFQFLIGTVKQAFRARVGEPGAMFQFLIGTVKLSRLRYHVNTFLFQFLIGTVKTVVNMECIYSSEAVSIPHRYCKNLYYNYIEYEEEVSIPHRYCKN